MMKWIYLSFGGIVGTVARYVLSGAIYQAFGAQFPYGTLIVNLIGCFMMGILTTFADQKFLLDPNLKILLMVGFCGAFTTFSTFIFETSNLIRDGEMFKALANVLLSVFIGFLVFRLGILCGEII